MPAWVIVPLAVVVLLFLLPPLFARLPRTKSGSGFGTALQELNAVFNPGERHVQEARRQIPPAERENDEPKN